MGLLTAAEMVRWRTLANGDVHSCQEIRDNQSHGFVCCVEEMNCISAGLCCEMAGEGAPSFKGHDQIDRNMTNSCSCGFMYYL